MNGIKNYQKVLLVSTVFDPNDNDSSEKIMKRDIWLSIQKYVYGLLINYIEML